MLTADDTTREQRRLALRWEREAFKSGKWKPWEKIAPTAAMKASRGWTGEVTSIARNWLYVVLIRPIDTDWGMVHHLAIRTASNLEPPWRDKQRIKNELFGPEWVAVEVMPPSSELVDEANMYHIWVWPDARRLPFTIFQGKIA